jgi:hypothetical protein
VCAPLSNHNNTHAGSTALCFKGLWPSRFGNGVLAVKVMKDGSDAEIPVMQSFLYEATVLATAKYEGHARDASRSSRL